jgi:hypothetical protein
MTKPRLCVCVFPATFLVAAALAGAACSGTAAAPDGGGTSTGSDTPSGVVIGPLDNHCTGADGGLTIQPVGVCQVIDQTTVPANAGSCNVSFDADGGAGGDSDGGVAISDYGPTMYGSAADDDDCKYFVSWTATPIKENADTSFTVTVLRLADMAPVSCAGVRPDVSLTLAHGAPAPPNPSTEIAPGVYKVGPIKFDAKGTWTVRFHFFEECSDAREDSPHGHAAFYVNVP